MKITKAISDQNRVRILAALNGRELCVCQLVALLELAPSTVSKHISILRNADLVESRKEGLMVFYFLPSDSVALVRGIFQWLFEFLKENEVVKNDIKKIELILKKDIGEVCSLNRKNLKNLTGK
jgi:DNA-binding transcriptional ArsR family regulator